MTLLYSSVLDLCKRSLANFTFPVEQVLKHDNNTTCYDDNMMITVLIRSTPRQVQTVYRLLVRAEPALLERLCMAITESEAGTHEAEETEANVRKRKDETSRVLVYNSYIYPTLGNIPVTLHLAS